MFPANFLPQGRPLPPEQTAPPVAAESVDVEAEEKKRDKQPNTAPLAEIPTTGFYSFDRYWAITQALVALEQGQFQQAALLTDVILRDDRIWAVLQTRLNGLLGAPLKCKPGTPSRKARKLAERLQGTDDTPGELNQWFPVAELSDLMRWGIMLGVGVGELTWDTTGPEWIPRLHVWHPQFVFWLWDQSKPNGGAYWITTANRGTVEVTPGDGRWILFTPYGYRRAWLRGAVRCLAPLFLMRQWDYRDFARYNEVHGLPIRLAKVPSNASETDKQSFATSVANIGSETAIQIPISATDPASFGLDLLEAKADTYKGFVEFMAKLDDSIAIALLGNALTTQTTAPSAEAKIGDQVRGDIRKADAIQIGQCLREQAIRPFVRYNIPDADEAIASHVVFDLEPPKDAALEAQTMANAATALTTFKAAGIPVDVVAFAERFQIPLVEMDEDDLAALFSPPIPPPVEAPPEGAPGDGPAIAPGSEQAVDPQSALNGAQITSLADIVAQVARRELSRESALQMMVTAFPIDRATAERIVGTVGKTFFVDDEDGAQMATHAATARMVALKASPRLSVAPPANKIAHAAVQAGRKALAPDLAVIMRAIGAATSYDDLRARLVEAFAGMDPRETAKVVERAGILAELAGRNDVLKGL